MDIHGSTHPLKVDLAPLPVPQLTIDIKGIRIQGFSLHLGTAFGPWSGLLLRRRFSGTR
jgi:hypothetical protein